MKNKQGITGRRRSRAAKWKFLWIPLAAFVMSLFLFLTPLDLKLFDLFQRSLPSLTESSKITVLTLDDASIDYAGGFPFRREVMADVVILLKELGVKSITFDLSYLDESPYRLDPVNANESFLYHLDDGFLEINGALNQFIDASGRGEVSGEDTELFREEFISLNKKFRLSLEEFLAALTNDVDDYFARALEMSGCSWLTLTMIGKEHLLDNSEIMAPEEAASKQLDRIALVNIDSANDHKTPEMASVMPAIPKLLERARGAGVVNADPDLDGIRRRLHLLFKYQGKYYPNLALTGMMELLGNPSIAVTDDAIILKKEPAKAGADMRIPRARDGSVLLNWPKKQFRDYRQASLIEFIQHTFIEPHLAENLSVMSESGFFSFWDGGTNPYDYYVAAESIKADILQSYSAPLVEEWLGLRRLFFDSVERLFSGDYENRILAAVSGDTELEEYVKELFSASAGQYFRMKEIRGKTDDLNGSFCVIGADATSMTDNGTTPFEENFPNVGTYAVLANMLLSGEFISEAPLYVSVIIALIFSFGIALVVARLGAGRSLVAGLLGLALLSFLLLSFFHLTKNYIAALVPLASTAITFLAITIFNFLSANRERAFLHSAFSRYLSPQVINEIIADPSKLNLGGEKRFMTALFTDIQGFSTLSEKLDPTQLVGLINRYLTIMSNIIMKNSGTVDKYEGDAIIAFFGAPLPREDHAVLACLSALAMKKAETILNAEIVKEGLSPSPLFTRIGINSGEMVVGNMGAENKMDYTIMGHAVNLAARLEGVNKQYKTGGILTSEYTFKKAGSGFVFRRLDRVRVVGINTPVRLYELLGLKRDAEENENLRVEKWEEAITLFENRNFAGALALFNAHTEHNPEDEVAKLYIQRCLSLIKNPPPNDWDGVYNLTEK